HALRLIQAHGTGGRLLDVGCGTGEFLGEAEAAGFSVFGVEPSETAYSIARQRHAVVRGELKDISLKEGSFDVATLWSVLEHVPDPFPFLEKVRLVLKKEGLLALRVPSARGLLAVLALWLYRASAGLVRRPLEVIYQLDWHYKHFFLYDRENLGLLLGKCGFKILAVEEDAGFDLRSLDFRMDYLPRSGGARILFMAALLVILQLSSFLGRRDELVVLARKSG
ncbi:MAG: class I SAM-dependent methyltransferase, partial [Candidatus Aminicenantes bacterium]|nr:class I SAM-dependent methyltransferase [Candidatus Aminicenantes bacterium]